jgi:ribosomal protein S18 acetylase RimI-like enzyme
MEQADKTIIYQLTSFSPELTASINHLLIQINPAAHQLTDTNVQEILQSQSTQLLVAKEPQSDRIVGMITLVVYRIPFVKKALLEDLVVDNDFRGKGIGSALIKKALEQARNEGVKYVDLTSNPKRSKANQLYQRLGFTKRDTNVYRQLL